MLRYFCQFDSPPPPPPPPTPEEHTPTPNRRYHTREINVKPDRMNEWIKRTTGQMLRCGRRRKERQMMRKAWLVKRRLQYFGKHGFNSKCFNGRFLRICFFGDDVCTRNSISLDLLELEPFYLFCFHQKWFLHTITEGYMYSLYALCSK